MATHTPLDPPPAPAAVVEVAVVASVVAELVTPPVPVTVVGPEVV
jgi:hypothetical protein